LDVVLSASDVRSAASGGVYGAVFVDRALEVVRLAGGVVGGTGRTFAVSSVACRWRPRVRCGGQGGDDGEGAAVAEGVGGHAGDDAAGDVARVAPEGVDADGGGAGDR